MWVCVGGLQRRRGNRLHTNSSSISRRPFFVQPGVINDQGDPLGTLAFVRSHSSLICGNLVRDRAGVHVC